MADVIRAIFLSLILLFSLPAAAQDMGALFRQGMEAVEKGDHDKAIESFRKPCWWRIRSWSACVSNWPARSS